MQHHDTITVGEAPLATTRQGVQNTNPETGALNMLFQFEHMELDSVRGRQVLLLVCNFSADTPHFAWPPTLRHPSSMLLIANLPVNDTAEESESDLRPFEARTYLLGETET